MANPQHYGRVPRMTHFRGPKRQARRWVGVKPALPLFEFYALDPDGEPVLIGRELDALPDVVARLRVPAEGA